MNSITDEDFLEKVRRERLRRVIGKLGWLSFAGYAAASLCGADKISGVTSVLTVACAVVVNGMKASEEIRDIVSA